MSRQQQYFHFTILPNSDSFLSNFNKSSTVDSESIQVNGFKVKTKYSCPLCRNNSTSMTDKLLISQLLAQVLHFYKPHFG